MKVKYNKKLVHKEDDAVARRLQTNLSLQQKCQQAQKDLCDEREKIMNEHRQAVHAAARFAHFLENNGILSLNDGVEDYILYHMREAEDIIADARKNGHKDTEFRQQNIKSSLNAQLQDFREQKRVLQTSISAANKESGGGISAGQVHGIMATLMKLPTLGPILQRCQAANLQAERQTPMRKDTVVSSQARRQRGKGFFSVFEGILW